MVQVITERPARPIPDGESVAGVDDGDAGTDWEPGTTTGIPPGDDDGDVLTWDEDTGTWGPAPGGSITVEEDDSSPSVTGVNRIQFAADDFSVTDNLDGSVLVAAFTSGVGLGLPWFVVTDPAYGALGDGSTDDTSAINSAIADLNTATRGVLYFPAGSYKVTGALTTITASGMVMGDGMGAYDGSGYVSAILFTSQTAVLFTVTGETVLFRDIGLFNTYAGTASAGCAIKVNGSFIGQKVDLDSIVVAHFYDNVVRDVGSQWVNHNVWNWGVVRYGESIQNTVNQDAGDWTIEGCNYYADTNNGTAAIFSTGAGGGKITGTKINGHSGATYGTGIRVAVPTGRDTSILMISGGSIENVSGDAVYITTAGTGTFGLVTIAGLQVGLYSNNSGRAVKIVAATAGGVGVGGGIYGCLIDALVARTDGTARAAVELTNTDRVTLGDMALVGFNARYTSTTDTNTTDSGAASSLTIKDEGSPLATAATSIDFVGAGVVASGTGAAKTVTIAGGTAYDTDGLIEVDPGTKSVSAGPPFVVTVTSTWGIAAGVPYYDASNAVAGEEAALYYNPTTDEFVLVAYGF